MGGIARLHHVVVIELRRQNLKIENEILPDFFKNFPGLIRNDNPVHFNAVFNQTLFSISNKNPKKEVMPAGIHVGNQK